MKIQHYIKTLPNVIQLKEDPYPWEVTSRLQSLIEEIITELGPKYTIENGIAIHQSVEIEQGITIKSPAIIMENCFIGAHAYLREGVILGPSVKIGPGSEIKSSIICADTAIAHFNYIGNSIIGNQVNFEAGSVAANHFNEREDKRIVVYWDQEKIDTGVTKFGSLVGDGSRIGANAVLSPGTILPKKYILKRFELIEQVQDF